MRELIDAVGSRGHQPAYGAVADDLCVRFGVGHARCVGLYLARVSHDTGAARQFGAAVTQRDDVDWMPIGVQLKDQTIKISVVFPRKGGRSQVLAENVDQVRLAKHCAQDAVLGFKTLKFHHWAASDTSRKTARLTRASRRGATLAPRKNTWLRLFAFWKNGSQKPCPLW